MPKHVHAELMMQYAQDAMENERPWELWELYERGNNWLALDRHPNWFAENKYRRKPKTVNINGFELVQELVEAPGLNGYIESLKSINFTEYGHLIPERLIGLGIAHKTKESAIASCKARLGIDPNS